MHVSNIHPWNVSCGEAVAIQRELVSRLILDDCRLPLNVKTIAGADISYARRSDLFFAVVLVFSYPGLELVEEASHTERVKFPYIPGLLSFREAPPLLEAFAKLKRPPDAAIFDGQGIAHPRGFGLASHMGLFLDIPTIGCAKKRLVGTHDEVGEDAGSYTDLLLGEKKVGAALRTKRRVKPVFVSQGHRVGIDESIGVVMNCCRGYRLPEPTRRAHLAVNRLRLHGDVTAP